MKKLLGFISGLVAGAAVVELVRSWITQPSRTTKSVGKDAQDDDTYPYGKPVFFKEPGRLQAEKALAIEEGWEEVKSMEDCVALLTALPKECCRVYLDLQGGRHHWPSGKEESSMLHRGVLYCRWWLMNQIGKGMPLPEETISVFSQQCGNIPSVPAVGWIHRGKEMQHGACLFRSPISGVTIAQIAETARAIATKKGLLSYPGVIGQGALSLCVYQVVEVLGKSGSFKGFPTHTIEQRVAQSIANGLNSSSDSSVALGHHGLVPMDIFSQGV